MTVTRTGVTRTGVTRTYAQDPYAHVTADPAPRYSRVTRTRAVARDPYWYSTRDPWWRAQLILKKISSRAARFTKKSRVSRTAHLKEISLLARSAL